MDWALLFVDSKHTYDFYFIAMPKGRNPRDETSYMLVVRTVELVKWQY